tara:strand:- start:34687 stop:34866 length:180 start_codon:yes stop_codon:yes gene_type:complete
MEARRRDEFMSRMKRYEETLWEEPVSKEEARVWLARCRASLHGGDKSDKLGSSGEKEER